VDFFLFRRLHFGLWGLALKFLHALAYWDVVPKICKGEDLKFDLKFNTRGHITLGLGLVAITTGNFTRRAARHA